MQLSYEPVAIVFPGQGSQYPGMGREIYEYSQRAKEIFDTADMVLGLPLKELCFNGPEERLTLTENAQPAILTHTISIWSELKNHVNIFPRMFSGHSLGEYSALVATGALTFNDALLLVRNRGRYMQEAVPAGTGSMAAIIGLDIDMVREAIDASRGGDVLEIANYNAPDQLVVAGNSSAVARCVDKAKELGARRCILLNVSAPFHCPLMSPAAERLRKDIANIHFDNMSVPVVTNVTAMKVFDGEAFRQLLVEQVTNPVLWVDCIKGMINDGVKVFIEVGPGKVLSGLIKRIDKKVSVINIEKPGDIQRVKDLIYGG